MEIEILRWEPTSYLESSTASDNTIGRVKLCLNKKFFVWMIILRSKKGFAFAKLPSIKIGNVWESAIGWPDDPEKEKWLSKQVINILKERKDL